ncbi:hypothetical protein CAPTEDRAFT_213796 [Capitella teleta]|uniref:Uncharacterized protein n=1 Tax=Capitella teleta TaxID=283909 RepID=R7UEP0_CAPTE|nr:hypothetical protein CAPTEDRAFT_213796 [Capitella teleta]|eukprot:ELU02258.1 hypothetical protein CAPTEDRAFT_213796 [Capitella teleta]
MPLTSLSQVYKTFPSMFADTVIQHTFKRRTEANTRSGQQHSGSAGEILPPVQCLPATCLVEPYETVTSPRPPSCESIPVPASHSHRGSSPCIASSLENVDLWEESEDDEEFDQIDGVSINPRNTMDLSDLRTDSPPQAAQTSTLNNTFHGYDPSTRAQLAQAKRETELKDCGRSNHGNRRVKFSNLVTVQEGNFSTFDLLRNSHNSAKRFRQKHLTKSRTSDQLFLC